ncbi:hypothetical protein [Kribbella solani]|uniref:hypothetical protein n=1 Tax=Kribbella solani TaxID=236067 RepID=UPI0029BCFE6C|nr:hypothetical protein [Kribbella solani]MDX2970553.1 hypothetical protein [Kribbella solani]
MSTDERSESYCTVPVSPIAPFSLYLYADGNPAYVLDLNPRARTAAEATFAEYGLTGEPQDWFTVAVLAGRQAGLDLIEYVESGRLTFTNYGYDYGDGEMDPTWGVTASEEDIAVLSKLGTTLHQLYHDKPRLAELIRDDLEAFEDTDS